jgi:hypothetical protein
MTKFKREDFSYDGGYLMYDGDAGKYNEFYSEPCHPSNLGRKKSLFVARFKYSGKDKARFLTFLINNFTPEEYFAAYNTPNPANPWKNTFSPSPILEAKGYISATLRKMMKDAGYTVFTKETYREWSNKTECGSSEYWTQKDAEHAAILAACANA